MCQSLSRSVYNWFRKMSALRIGVFVLFCVMCHFDLVWSEEDEHDNQSVSSRQFNPGWNGGFSQLNPGNRPNWNSSNRPGSWQNQGDWSNPNNNRPGSWQNQGGDWANPNNNRPGSWQNQGNQGRPPSNQLPSGGNRPPTGPSNRPPPPSGNQNRPTPRPPSSRPTTVRPNTQRPSRPTTQRPSRPTTERPSRPSNQRPSRPTTQRPSRPTTQRPSRPNTPRPGSSGNRPTPPTDQSSTVMVNGNETIEQAFAWNQQRPTSQTSSTSQGSQSLFPSNGFKGDVFDNEDEEDGIEFKLPSGCECKFSKRYDIVCGSNAVTYKNKSLLNCHKECGVDVDFVRYGSCYPNS